MKKTIFWLGVVFLLSMNLSAEISTDELLKKTERIALGNMNLIPGLVRTEIYHIGKNGEKKNRMEIVMKTELTENNEVKNSLVSASEDGKELDEKNENVKKYLETEYRPGNNSLFIFDEENTPTFVRTNRCKQINGTNCVAFDYTKETEIKDKAYTEKGTLWVEEISGKPVLRISVLDPLPKMMKKMMTKVSYKDENGKWICSQISSDIEVNIVFKKIKVHTEVNYSDYWDYKAARK